MLSPLWLRLLDACHGDALGEEALEDDEDEHHEGDNDDCAGQLETDVRGLRRLSWA
jgi:hypothetical protein